MAAFPHMEHKASVGSLLAALALLAACSGAGYWIATTGPEQEKHDKEATVVAVEVQPLVAEGRSVSIEAFGTTRPARQVTLHPEAQGRIVRMHEGLEPGALVKQGELVLAIDPSSYQIDVEKAQAALETAEAAYAIEEGSAAVAKKEWELFAKQGSEAQSPNPLALREPQMKQAKARISTAKADLAEAFLWLSRTELRVPFDAVVLEESIEVGRRVDESSEVATLVGVETFWATVTMPIAQAGRLDALERDAPVTVRLASGLGDAIEREGKFVRRLPDLETEGRMARALIAIDDPLGLVGGAPPIPLDAYVSATIGGGVLDSVYAIPRTALRENDRVWVRDGEGKLAIRDIDVVWREEHQVNVRADFQEGDELILSYLPDPLPGIELRVRKSP